MPSKKLDNKKISHINKKNFVYAGIILSVAFNVIILAIAAFAFQQSYSGKTTFLEANDFLMSTTCRSYLNKQKKSDGPTTNVNGIDFNSVYLSDTSDNLCNRIVLSSQYEIKSLLETNNSNAIDYYLNTTKLNTASRPSQIEIPIYYDNKTKLPIDLTTQDFVTY